MSASLDDIERRVGVACAVAGADVKGEKFAEPVDARVGRWRRRDRIIAAVTKRQAALRCGRRLVRSLTATAMAWGVLAAATAGGHSRPCRRGKAGHLPGRHRHDGDECPQHDETKYITVPGQRTAHFHPLRRSYLRTRSAATSSPQDSVARLSRPRGLRQSAVR